MTLTDVQFFSLIFGGWSVFLLLLVWVLLLQRKVKPGSLWPAMLLMGLATCPVTLARLGLSWMSLAVLAMPFIGIWINRLSVRQWARKGPA